MEFLEAEKAKLRKLLQYHDDQSACPKKAKLSHSEDDDEVGEPLKEEDVQEELAFDMLEEDGTFDMEEGIQIVMN